MSPTCFQTAFVPVRRVALALRVHPTLTLLLALVLFVPQMMFADSPGNKITITGNIPTGVATEAYTASVTASGGRAPYKYQASNLPQKLSINKKTGVISGVCSTVGQFSFNIFVTDALGKFGNGSFTVTFTQPPVSISVSPTTVTVPSSGSQQFLATVLNTTNTAVTWTASQGTISTTGSYVAPAVTSNTAVTVTATSVADTTKTAKSNVTVSTSKAPPVALELLFPPTSPFQPYYADVQTYLLNNPTVAGVTFWLEWGTVDNGPNANPQYDFSAFDASIAPWIAVGKKVNIVVWAVSDTDVNHATPQYVFDNLGPSNTTICAGEEVPNYFQSAFQLPYEAFMAQVVQHFGNNGSIGYIRIGLGRGGETFPGHNFGTDPCTSTFINNWGWTDATWTNYVDSMLNYESTLKSPKQMGVGIDSYDSDSMPESEAATAVSLKFGIGNEGLELSDVTNYPHCGADWCALFDEYAGTVPMELQTYLLSDPTNNPPVGSLVVLLPFAVSHHATVFEIYTDDWLLAYDPNYPGNATYGAGYVAAFKAAAEGK